MKHLKSYKVFESEFVDKYEVDELLDKISQSGIESLSDIDRNRLTLFSEGDKEIIETIEKMGDITNKFRELNQTLNRLSSEGKSDEAHELFQRDWMKLNDQLRPLEASFRKWGIELGDPRLDKLMRKVRPDAYNRQVLERSESMWKSSQAREAISEIYTIVDEIYLDPRRKEDGFVDFLVEMSEFTKYAEDYNGFFAGNRFQTFKEFESFITNYIDGIISPLIYVAPFWMSRTKEDIVNFGDVYSDTIYVKVIDTEPDKEELEEINKVIKADEIHLMTSKSGDKYVRFWWD